jgi:hypothetical protein
MEICIDTKKDSSDDIKKAIEFLQKFVDGGSSGSGSASFNLGSDVSGSMGSIFGDDQNSGSDKKDDSKKRFSDDEVRIIPY